jgi:hypothetical protein
MYQSCSVLSGQHSSSSVLPLLLAFFVPKTWQGLECSNLAETWKAGEARVWLATYSLYYLANLRSVGQRVRVNLNGIPGDIMIQMY